MRPVATIALTLCAVVTATSPARTEEEDAWLSWAFNIVDDFGLRAWQLNNGPWNPAMGIPGTDSERGVFRINGTLVPAPGMLAMLAVAGLAAPGSRRRRS